MPAQQSSAAGRHLVDFAYSGLGDTEPEAVQPEGRRRVDCAPRQERARQTATSNLTMAQAPSALEGQYRHINDAAARPPIERLPTVPAERGDPQPDVPVATVAPRPTGKRPRP